MEKRVSKTKIELLEGDITELDTQAIVNAANNHFWMGAGVAGVIKRKGGKEIEEEAVKQGPRPVGEAIVTPGGRLKARYVIHAAVMGQDLVTDSEKIGSAAYNSLLRAHELGIESIAFPALGTGKGGFPLQEAARVMFSAVKRFADEHPDTSLEKVAFCLYGKESYKVFEDTLKEII